MYIVYISIFLAYFTFGLWLPYTLITDSNPIAVLVGILWGIVFHLLCVWLYLMYGRKR